MNKYKSEDSEPCKFLSPNGSCENCPHVILDHPRKTDYIPICYIEEQKDE